jgi:hypothetical protein
MKMKAEAMEPTYKTFSPWAKTDDLMTVPLAPRLDTLDGKTIGLFASFKGHAKTILKEVADGLSRRFPSACFSCFQYPLETSDIANDDAYFPAFKKWLEGVDGVIAGYGDDGSGSMFLAMCTSAAEKLGKPSVMLVKEDLRNGAQRGASARMVPDLRFVCISLMDLSVLPVIGRKEIDELIVPEITPILEDIAGGLTGLLNHRETTAVRKTGNDYADEVFEGSLEQVNDHYYARGWTNGLPIVPPTREAVDAMLRATDLPADSLVAKLPPMLGNATVEKIAINAVMAGCLPVHLPVVIALVRAMADPAMHLVGWACSVAGFAPVVVVNGPVSRQLGFNCGSNILPPYSRSNAAISRAFAFILMNIAGIRPSLEDNAYTGHEARFGICFAEDELNSPWKPYHTGSGFEERDSTVTLVWYQNRQILKASKDPASLLKVMCKPEDVGYNPGCSFVISATAAQILADIGMSRDDVRDYICEYSRKPASQVPIRWLKDNNHLPPGFQLPLDTDASCRQYWNTDHLQVFVAGGDNNYRGVALIGGGDHGGPTIARIDVPEKWDELLEEYQGSLAAPDFVKY